MKLTDRVLEAFASAEGASMVAAVVTQEMDAAFGRRIGSSALPERPGDGSVGDVVLAPDVVEMVRGLARREVAARKRTMKGAMEMLERRKKGGRPPSLRVLEAVTHRSPRSSRAAQSFLERRQGMIDRTPVPDTRR